MRIIPNILHIAEEMRIIFGCQSTWYVLYFMQVVTESYAVEGKGLSGAIRNGGRRHLPMIVCVRKRKLLRLEPASLESIVPKLSIYTYPQYWSAGEVAAASRRCLLVGILLLCCVVNTLIHI